MATMQVQLVAPDRMVWSGQAEIILARTVDGELGILPRHEPLLGVLVENPVRIRRADDDELVAAVHGGFLSVSAESVDVLAEIVELAAEIDVPRARAALERTKDSTDEEDKAAARRAVARLRAAGEDV
ncbi:MAG TPA: F0F1 ATP synthase subunit epsilon [Mycobacteriales bacterium]|nr:F0F1 ATP synthase subunit epsilon [Mycobacteriales bacterium]